MEILSGREMREVDRRAIDERGIDGLLLMESAGAGVAAALMRDEPRLAQLGVIVLCGKGNNGGDGLVIARHLAGRAIVPKVVLLAAANELTGAAAINLRAARGVGLDVVEVTDDAGWDAQRGGLTRGGVVVDAMLGTGIRGGAHGLVARVIADLDSAGCRVFSVDLPSGLDADSTEIPGPAVRAERTYTLCRPKLPLVFGPAALLAGRLNVVPIGIPDDCVAASRAALEWLDAGAVAGLLPRRPAESHKGSYGHLIAVAGSRGKAGAAVLLGRAALRSGIGLVTVAVPDALLECVAAMQAELMTAPLPQHPDGGIALEATQRVLALCERGDALAVGPGLGDSESTRAAVAELLARVERPTVVDADGLNALAGGGDRALGALRRPGGRFVLTPHPGEAARLLGSSSATVQSDRTAAVRELCVRSGAIVVLKGHRTLIASPDGRLSINASGNPGLATAGTGDVLCGMLGAFLSRGLEPRDAARLAVFAHGDAGDRAAARLGTDGLIASDVIECIPDALRALCRASEVSSR